MKSLLIIDAGIFILAAVTAFLKGDPGFIIDIIGLTGLIFFAIAGVLSGSFVSGDRVRANYEDEYKELKEKNRLSKNLFYVGLFNIAISVLTYEFTLQ
ncbi:DUF5316 family protein [Methanosarcina sp. T3]|uniref:DUF5316 family protein n=1 Tax=Methanosarcina sp. T3 TaxID=3439062 RepID=UPI003F84DE4C